MKTTFLLFAATRYWTDAEELQKTYGQMARELEKLSGEIGLIVDGDMTKLPETLGNVVIVPMSGAVQRFVLQAAERARRVVMYAGYCSGNFEEAVVEKLLYYNAAPTLMDTWAVLRRRHAQAYLAVTRNELEEVLCAAAACDRMQNSKLIRIGATEPWVISNASSTQTYCERLGIAFEQVEPEEVIRRYEETTAQEARWMAEHFGGHAREMCGPKADDLINACRFGVALLKTLEAHDAQGGAIACFNLIARTGINACLGVAYLNDCTDRFMACEGDMDSAVTMLLMGGMAKDGLWMANPCLDASGHINFSHCTALWHVAGQACPFALRHHHETGIGVSLDVEFPKDRPLTLCRISDECRAMTIHRGQVVPGPRKPVCHTQMWVEVENYPHYLHTALGCHQVIAFENMENKLQMAARMLGLQVL